MAPTTHRRRDKSPNYDRLRTRSSLRRAWGSVRHAATNASPSTRRLVARFEAGELRNLERIGEQLRDGEFEFGIRCADPVVEESGLEMRLRAHEGSDEDGVVGARCGVEAKRKNGGRVRGRQAVQGFDVGLARVAAATGQR